MAHEENVVVEEEESAELDRGRVWVSGGFKPGDHVHFVLDKALTIRPTRVKLRLVGSDREIAGEIADVQAAGTGSWRRWTSVVVRLDGEATQDTGVRWWVYGE